MAAPAARQPRRREPRGAGRRERSAHGRRASPARLGARPRRPRRRAQAPAWRLPARNASFQYQARRPPLAPRAPRPSQHLAPAPRRAARPRRARGCGRGTPPPRPCDDAPSRNGPRPRPRPRRNRPPASWARTLWRGATWSGGWRSILSTCLTPSPSRWGGCVILLIHRACSCIDMRRCAQRARGRGRRGRASRRAAGTEGGGRAVSSPAGAGPATQPPLPAAARAGRPPDEAGRGCQGQGRLHGLLLLILL
jgi:hypothetical protein